MADQILTTLFVAPTSNTLPTSGSTNNLTSGQFGIFMPDNSPATTATVGNAKYIYLAQGRNVSTIYEGSRKSDWIYPQNVIKWYKVTGNLQQATQVTKISAFSLGCNEDVSVTLRLDSFYIRTAYYNGLTRSVMVTTPCCDCGDNPCDSLSAADYESTIVALAAQINADNVLNQYVTAGTQGSGASTAIIVAGRTLQEYGQGTSNDLTNFPYQFDRMSFRTFVRTGPGLTTDYEVADACDTVATVAILQRAAYPMNTPAEIKQLEKDFFSYQADQKSIFSDVNFNGEYSTYVDSALAYNLYYLNYYEPIIGNDMGTTRKDEWSVIAIPKGDASEAGTIAILSAIFGTADDDVTTPTTTSTYTTSSTTSTTTTTTTP